MASDGVACHNQRDALCWLGYILLPTSIIELTAGEEQELSRRVRSSTVSTRNSLQASYLIEHLLRFVILLVVLLGIFVFGVVAGYEPLVGFIIAIAIGFVALYYARPVWFAYLTIFLLCFAGLLNLPVTTGGFSSAVAISSVALGLSIFGCLLTRDHQLIKIFTHRFDLLLPLVFFVAMMISMKNSREIGFSFIQIQQFLYIIIIYYFMQLVIRNRRSLDIACLVFIIGGFCVEIIGLYEGILLTPIYVLTGGKSLLGADLSDTFVVAVEGGRINGVIGDAPFHGIFITVTAAFSMYFLFSSKRYILKVFCILVFILAIYNVVGSGSRGAFIAFVSTLFVFWTFATIPHKMVFLVVAVIICIVVISVLMLFVSERASTIRIFTSNSKTSETAEMRVKNIPVALKMFFDYPVVGIGPDGFVINFGRYAANVSNLSSRENVMKTHNTPVQILAEYGLVGFTIFVLIIFTAARRMITFMRGAIDRRDQMLAVTLLATIVGYVFFMLTSNSLLDMYFWLIIIFAQVFTSVSLDQVHLPKGSVRFSSGKV